MHNVDQAMTIQAPNVQVVSLFIHSLSLFIHYAHIIYITKTFNFRLVFRLVCTCLPGYTGNPLSHCVRGECQSDSECPDSRACINYSCIDPCIGQCGANAICEAQRHIAVCKCPRGYDGNAASSCVRQSRAYYPFSRYYKKKWTATQSTWLINTTNASNETYT